MTYNGLRGNYPSFRLGRPQDILHGEMNGLIQVPAEVAEGLPKAIESVRTRVRLLIDIVKGPELYRQPAARPVYALTPGNAITSSPES